MNYLRSFIIVVLASTFMGCAHKVTPEEDALLKHYQRTSAYTPVLLEFSETKHGDELLTNLKNKLLRAAKRSGLQMTTYPGSGWKSKLKISITNQGYIFAYTARPKPEQKPEWQYFTLTSVQANDADFVLDNILMMWHPKHSPVSADNPVPNYVLAPTS